MTAVLGLPLANAAGAASPAGQQALSSTPASPWASGIEGQRRADLGNGTYLNPIIAGDHSDPTVLKDGRDYYMTFSTSNSYPSLIVWHSRDLVNWRPVTAALSKPMGLVFAADLAKHNGRYFIYIPILPPVVGSGLGGGSKIFVIHADTISGPWSDPVDLGIEGFIDPGHIVGEDGKRYLFLNGVSRVRLTDDGLATAGAVEHVYDGWRYPDDWVTEAYALEGPKLLRHGEFFYLVSAVGGTAGPTTSHMVIAARARSINGPWENCPHNPIVHTRSASEYWWSRGHATLVEGPASDWWMIYHAYENGYRTLGRQVLLEPIEWTPDGWFRATGGDLSRPLLRPRGGEALSDGIARSDDFATLAMGTRWSLYEPDAGDLARIRLADSALVLSGKGSSPSDCSPLTGIVGDHAYEISVALDLMGDATGGLLLFFNKALFLGMGIDGKGMTTYKAGKRSFWHEEIAPTRSIHLRIVNDRHIVSFYYSHDGKTWTRHGLRSETSGYNVNVADDLWSLRPALFASGGGSVRFRDFCYRALP